MPEEHVNQDGQGNVGTNVDLSNYVAKSELANYVLKTESDSLVANARQQEKDKLYGEITTLKGTVSTLKEELKNSKTTISDFEKTAGEKDAQIEKLEAQITKLKEENGVNKMKNEDLQALADKIAKLEQDVQDRDAKMAQLEAERELAVYRAEKIVGLDDSVVDLVAGKSKEEIDASVEKAKAVYEKVVSKALKGATPKQGVPLPNPSANAVNNIVKETKDIDIAGMTMEEYAAFRKKIGLK